MPMKATIEILIDTDTWGDACDSLAESIGPLLQESGGKSIVDWRYVQDWTQSDGAGFDYVPRSMAPPTIASPAPANVLCRKCGGSGSWYETKPRNGRPECKAISCDECKGGGMVKPYRFTVHLKQEFERVTAVIVDAKDEIEAIRKAKAAAPVAKWKAVDSWPVQARSIDDETGRMIWEA